MYIESAKETHVSASLGGTLKKSQSEMSMADISCLTIFGGKNMKIIQIHWLTIIYYLE